MSDLKVGDKTLTLDEDGFIQEPELWDNDVALVDEDSSLVVNVVTNDGDIDGDTVPDLAVGASGDDDGGLDRVVGVSGDHDGDGSGGVLSGSGRCALPPRRIPSAALKQRGRLPDGT